MIIEFTAVAAIVPRQPATTLRYDEALKYMGEAQLKDSATFGALATLAAMATYGLVHSLLASRWIKAWSRRQFGEWHERFYRLFYNTLGGVTFLPVLAVAGLTPSELLYQISPPWLWLTISLQLGAVVALLVGLKQTNPLEFLGVSQLMGEQDQSVELVRTGLYRWVRHPLYTAGLVFIWLLPVMTTNLLALNIGITLYLYIGSIFEERKLVAEWGDEYRQYQRQVPRLIPIPGKHASDPQ